MDNAQQTIVSVLDEVRARVQAAAKCTEVPCHDPFCRVHWAQEWERLRSAAWTPPPGAEPWHSLKDGTLSLASIIDHTILRPDATEADIEEGCREAVELQCATFCINPIYVPLVARRLSQTPVRVCTVVGFPLGASPSTHKVREARWAISQGASEIDMVMPIGKAKGAQYQEVYLDISEVVHECHSSGARCKVIIETALLTSAEKIAACLLAARAGADFVKTSTGFSTSGATSEDVALMRLVVDNALGVKASGGIRTREQALAMLASGANRIGTSSSAALTGTRRSGGRA